MELMEGQANRSLQQHRVLFAQLISLAAAVCGSGAQTLVPGQLDAICRAQCEILALQQGSVKYLDRRAPATTIVLGKYAASAKNLAPPTELPVSDLRTPRGWRVVVTAYLDHEEDDLMSHVWFFGPDGKLASRGEALSFIEEAKVGRLASVVEIYALTSVEEHAYNAQTTIWLLRQSGEPKAVLEISGMLAGLSDNGVTVRRQTYDGVHAETKGTVAELYVWNAATESVTRK